jgi:hypothetical protein
MEYYMVKLDKETLALTLSFDCDRFLKFRLSSPSQLAALGVERPGYVRPGLELVKREGKIWEALKYNDLIEASSENSVAYTLADKENMIGNLKTFSKIENLFEILSRENLPQFILEAEFDVPEYITKGFEEAHRKFALDKARLRPDIIWVRPGKSGRLLLPGSENPEYELQIIDIKLATELSLKHISEISYYALALNAALEESPLRNRFAVAADGFIWPGTFDRNSFRSLIENLSWQGKECALTEALEATLVPVSLEIYGGQIRSFLDTRVMRVMQTEIDKINWHVGTKCQMCDYLSFCTAQAAREDHLSRIAWLNQGQASLIRSCGINTTAELHDSIVSMNEKWVAVTTASQQLRAEGPALAARAQALQENRPIVIPGRQSMAMHRWSDQSIYITLHYDPGSGITFAFGASRILFPNGQNSTIPPLSEEKVFLVETNEEKNNVTESVQFKEFAQTVAGWLTSLAEENKGLSSHIFFWDTRELNQLKRLLDQYKDQPSMGKSIDILLDFFPPEGMLPDVQLFRSVPFTILDTAIKSLIALPLAHSNLCINTANVLCSPGNRTLSIPTGFCTPLNDQIPFERAYELWNDEIFLRHIDEHFIGSIFDAPAFTRQELLEGIQEAIRNHLSAMRQLVEDLRQQYGKLLLPAKEKFTLPKQIHQEIPKESENLVAFCKLNEASEELDITNTRCMSVDEREARFYSIRGLRRKEAGEEKKIIDGIKTLNPKKVKLDDEFFVFDVAETSRDSRINESDFLIAITNEESTIDLRKMWREDLKLNENDAQKLILEYKKCYNSVKHHWISNMLLGELLQVTIVKFEPLETPPFIVLKPNDKDLFHLAVGQEFVNLDKPLVLDPIYRDFASFKIEKALTLIGGPPSSMQKTSRNMITEPAYSLMYDYETLKVMYSFKSLKNLYKKVEPYLEHPFNEEQQRFFRQSFSSRVSLLWGPPGTGKTKVLAGTVMGWIEAFIAMKKPVRICIASSNYNAIDNVLIEILKRARARKENIGPLDLVISRIQSGLHEGPEEDEIEYISSMHSSFFKLGNSLDKEDGLCRVIGGTWHQLNKLAEKMQEKLIGEKLPTKPWFDLLVIDEASQVSVYSAASYFLLLKLSGHVLIAGDDRQLGPIYGYQMREDTSGLYDCIYSYMKARHSIQPIQLRTNYRTNREIAEWPAERFYHNNYISFEPERKLDMLMTIRRKPADWPESLLWSDSYLNILDPEIPVVVISYDSISATVSNPFEAQIASALALLYYKLLKSNFRRLTNEVFWDEHLGIVTPHRAQKASIRNYLVREGGMEATPPPIIDTVDRFQGKERDFIISSYVVSDPDFITSEESFILDPRRFNVTLTRAKSKCVILISNSLLRHRSKDPKLARSAAHLQLFAEQFCNSLNQEIALPFFDQGEQKTITCTMRGRVDAS